MLTLAFSVLWLGCASIVPRAGIDSQYRYETNGNAIVITKYIGSGGAVTIPSTINGLTVSAIGINGFRGCTNLISVTIPGNITCLDVAAFSDCRCLTNVTIGEGVREILCQPFRGCENLTRIVIPKTVRVVLPSAFSDCPRLTGIYFQGNAPEGWLSEDSKATIYHLPNTTGWGETFGGRPTAVWKP